MTETTAAPTRAITRDVAHRLNGRLSPATRQRVHYQPGSYDVFGARAWCVWRWAKWRGGWHITGAVARRRWR